MSRPAQDRIRRARQFVPRFAVLTVVVSLSSIPTACTSRGSAIGGLAVDRAIVTASIAPAPERRIPEAETDAGAIALAMSRSGDDWTGDGGVDWKNSADGARGSITQVTAYSADDDESCRRFTTTRERFDGVGLLRGEACRDGDGAWRVTSLEAV